MLLCYCCVKGIIDFSSKTTHARFISYSRTNSTKLPASGANNVSEPRLTSQLGSVGGVV